MRCYFMRDGHIAAVKMLTVGISDAEAIETSKALFHEREATGFYDGFEVWDQARHLYRYPPLDGPDANAGHSPSASGPRPEELSQTRISRRATSRGCGRQDPLLGADEFPAVSGLKAADHPR